LSELPGPEPWRRRLAERARFLQLCAEEASALGGRFGAPVLFETTEALPRAAGRDIMAPLVRIDLLIGAAELAFCLNETERALGLIRTALSDIRNSPTIMMFLARRAYFGVLIGEEVIIVKDRGLELPGFAEPWGSFATGNELLQSLAPLVYAGLASGPPEIHAQIVMSAADADSVAYSARLVFMASSEAAVVGLFNVARPRAFSFFDTPSLARIYASDKYDEAFAEARRLGTAALTMMEHAYQRRIDLLQFNGVAWNSSAPKASIVDWPLLMLHLALLRRECAGVLEAIPPMGGAARFIRRLALELFQSRQ
jgi:hypothetical protein